MKNFWILFALLTLATTSCQKVIDVDLNDANPRMVIEAKYNATDSIVLVVVSYTTSYFDNAPPQYVDNATVIITDGNGIGTLVPSIGQGVYQLNNYIPQTGTTYTMTVSHDGVDYTASSTLMPTLVQEIPTYEYYDSGFFSETGGYLVSFGFQDPTGLGNCYKAILTANDTTHNKLDEILIGDDELTDGNFIERPAFEFFDVGDTVSFEIQAIDQRAYDYYNELLTLTGGQSSAAPANPTYYWSNEALGSFIAYSYSRNGVTVTE